MRIPWLPFAILILLCALLDVYIYKALRRRCRSKLPARVQFVTAVALMLFAAMTVALPRRGGSDDMLLCIMWMLFAFLSVYAAKLVFVIVDLAGCIPMLWHRRRSRPVTILAVITSVFVFGALWWGALINRFNHQIINQDIYIDDLPAAFDNFRIVQISDLHVGTYGNDTTYVSHIVDIINDLHPDLIVFTGDIVNRRTDEIVPHVRPLSRLRARHGVYSILGNHDYGDYSDWPTDADKADNMTRLIDHQINDAGWHLLLNEHDYIVENGDSIALIGVENVGDPPFKTYGSLHRAYPTPGDKMTKILLTHNPAHWVDSISGNNAMDIDLTLSGHTHAMQVEVGGISPAALRYPTWGGLYSDGERQLYVNIGIGTVGMPMRLGATPEITILTLKNSKQK